MVSKEKGVRKWALKEGESKGLTCRDGSGKAWSMSGMPNNLFLLE